MNIKDSFARVGFTPEEKLDLTARLEQAAELEENMTNATKRKIKRISGGMVFGIAAAAVMTVGALAAVLNPGLHTWFDTTAPGASEVLESGIYRLDRSETCNGWTVTLDECVGDDSRVYIWVDVTAPEGTVLTVTEDQSLRVWFGMDTQEPEDFYSLDAIPDGDPTDNRASFLFKTVEPQNWRGQEVTVKLENLRAFDYEIEEPGMRMYHELSEITEAIQDHDWVFENVKLDYPDQTIRLEPQANISHPDGVITLSRLEISPLTLKMRLEGEGCNALIRQISMFEDIPGEVVTILPDGTVISSGRVDSGREIERAIGMWFDDMEIGVGLQDEEDLVPAKSPRCDHGTRVNAQGVEVPYVEATFEYRLIETYYVIAPALVDRISICGVDIPINPAASIPADQFAEVPAPQPAAPDTADTPEEAAPAVGSVTAGKGLNVRSGPGTQYKVVGGLREGARVTILGEENGFYQISYSEDQIGYVSKAYVSVG